MPDQPFDLIAFDGDDTLWHNERSYRDARDRFRRMLVSAGVNLTEDAIEARVSDTEIANIRFYGYGVSSFVLSLIETAIGLTSGRVTGTDLKDLIDLAKQMLTEEVELLAGARDTVTALSQRYPLMLITKGDLLHQTSKLERSGLRQYFTCVEVVSHKTPDVYAALLSRHRIEPARFLMVGNSLRSDVLPVIELGARAVYVPAELSWAHEHAEVIRAPMVRSSSCRGSTDSPRSSRRSRAAPRRAADQQAAAAGEVTPLFGPSGRPAATISSAHSIETAREKR